MICLNKLSKHYNDGNKVITAIDKISLTLNQGEFVVISGASGSGKSTLLNILSGTVYATSGEYYFDGIDTGGFDQPDWDTSRRRNIGLIYQDFRLIGDYTAEENIELVLALQYPRQRERKQYVKEVMEKTGVMSFAQKKVRLLSGGQKQRVAIARALATDAKFLLADEPTANLDAENANSIVALLKEISHDRLVVVVTHDDDLFSSVATRKIILSDGRIVQNTAICIPPVVPSLVMTVNNADEEFRPYGVLKSRRTMNVVFLSVLSILLFCLGLYSFFLNNITGIDEGLESTAYFQNLSPERYIVTKQDGSAFTPQDLSEIRELYNIRATVLEDVALDAVGYMENPYTHNKIEFNILPISVLDEELKQGNLPVKDDEVVIFNDGGSPWYMMESNQDYFNLYIGSTVSQSVRIVGWGDDSKHYRSSIYVSDMLFTRFYMDAISERSSIRIKTADISVEVKRIIPDQAVPSGTIIVNNRNELKGKADVIIENIHSTYTFSDVAIKELHLFSNLARKYEDISSFVLVNYNDFEMMLRNDYHQISVFSENQMQSWGTYNVIYPHAINKSHSNLAELVQRLFWFIMCLFMATAMILVCYLFLRHVLTNEVTNCYTRRLVGHTKRNVLSYIMVRISLPVVVAWVTATILYAVAHHLAKLPVNARNFIVFGNISSIQYSILSFLICGMLIALLSGYVWKKSNRNL